MRDVTAILMGDPAARVVRLPTELERQRSGFEVQPSAKLGVSKGTMTPFGVQVRAMAPGETLIAPSSSVAKGMVGQMERQRGWCLSTRTVTRNGVRIVELRRIK